MARKPSLSVVVMAHQSREKWFPYLRRKLGDVPFSVDDEYKRLGTWGNCRLAWQMHDMSADYCLVVQDDAIICEDFIERARDFIAEHPGASYQFFFGNRHSTRKIADESTTKDQGYIKSMMMWGVAICLPTHLVGDMIAFGDKLPPGTPDDTRIKRFLAMRKIPTYYPWPSLVDHRSGPSLVSRAKSENRIAINYVERVDIPKIIHQIWIGPKQPPERWIRTWQGIPGWEHKLWREEDIDGLKLKNRKLYDYYMSKGIYYGASDVARIEILDRFGGIYIDADTKRLKPWDDYGFMHARFFAVEANPRPGLPYRIANGVIGSVPGHPILRQYIKEMGQAEEVEPCWDTIGGTMLTRIILRHAEDPSIMVLEPYWFYPFSSRGYRHAKANQAIARHVWGSTKGLYQ